MKTAGRSRPKFFWRQPSSVAREHHFSVKPFFLVKPGHAEPRRLLRFLLEFRHPNLNPVEAGTFDQLRKSIRGACCLLTGFLLVPLLWRTPSSGRKFSKDMRRSGGVGHARQRSTQIMYRLSTCSLQSRLSAFPPATPFYRGKYATVLDFLPCLTL